MGMIADSMVDEWLKSQSKTDKIYRLIEKSTWDWYPEERILAITALGNSGDPRAVRSLIDCCQDQSPQIRLRAIEGLRNLRSGRAVEALIERLRDKKELLKTRLRAAAALATIRSFGAIRELRNLHADPDEDGTLRTFIGWELYRARLW